MLYKYANVQNAIMQNAIIQNVIMQNANVQNAITQNAIMQPIKIESRSHKLMRNKSMICDCLMKILNTLGLIVNLRDTLRYGLCFGATTWCHTKKMRDS